MQNLAFQVLLHFVGLCVFSDSIPGTTGLQVILPRVEYHGAVPYVPSIARMGGVTSQAWVTPPPPARHVEDHVAMLVFRTADLTQAINWGKPQPLPADSEHSYIRLDGDQLGFELLPGLTAQPGRLSAGIKLPHLKTDLCHNASASLSGGYLPAGGYRSAAAVFDLPADSMNSCMVSNKRLDTEVTLPALGELVIYSGRGRNRKELHLRPSRRTGRVDLIVANVPTSCLRGAYNPQALSSMESLSHVNVYYGMVAAPCKGTTISEWFKSLDASRPAACRMDIPPAAGGVSGLTPSLPNARIGAVPTDPPTPLMSDFECSNSQWP